MKAERSKCSYEKRIITKSFGIPSKNLKTIPNEKILTLIPFDDKLDWDDYSNKFQQH